MTRRSSVFYEIWVVRFASGLCLVKLDGWISRKHMGNIPFIYYAISLTSLMEDYGKQTDTCFFYTLYWSNKTEKQDPSSGKTISHQTTFTTFES